MYKAYSIASDIDGTMLQNNGDVAFLMYLEECGRAHAHALYRETHSWEAATGLTEAELSGRYADFLNSQHYAPPPPLPGAPAAFEQISRRCNIHLITSRCSKTRRHTLTHLSQHFPCRFASAAFDALGQKARRVQQIRAFAFLEDNPEHARGVAEVAKVILIPSPTTKPKSVHRNILLTAAHSAVDDGLSDEDWHRIWQHAWDEIPHLISDLITINQRTLTGYRGQERPPPGQSRSA